MTKLGAILFDDAILDALRDDQLVVFAGAGVSMGAPSSLDSFLQLAEGIAQGTGTKPEDPLDRFLGQLSHRMVDVHERAAHRLSPPGSLPNALHRDILRLFRSAERVRLVTTNFDLHFERAADELFGSAPPVYRAPALPLGTEFSGIVHVHGALPKASSLILTDADFGRAYLTEGWARRFLVDVFQRYTVLFVGYRHADTVMNYLARALPPDSIKPRFALTEEDGSWDLLGIKPQRFRKAEGSDPFKELNDGVRQLADRVSRGALDWRSRLSEMGTRSPPADEESISEIEQALRETHTTRFLLEVARGPEWLRWMNQRRHLKPLFEGADLTERDQLIADWMIGHFMLDHPNEMIEVLVENDLRLNPQLRRAIGWRLFAGSGELEEPILVRLVNILLASAPEGVESQVLAWLAERCARQKYVELVLKIFLAMSKPRIVVRMTRSPIDDGSSDFQFQGRATCVLHSDHSSLEEVWTKYLRPCIGRIAQPLLSGTVHWFRAIYEDLLVWDSTSPDRDPVSNRRRAIEKHAQDRYPEATDVLVDAARDALDWLAENSPAQHGPWTETLVAESAPLLRRLGIHASTTNTGKSPDEHLRWLLARVGLHGLSEHHEIYRAVARSYVAASEQVRQAVVSAILAYTRPGYDGMVADAATARCHFDWLSWLLESKPDCVLLGAALAPLNLAYPKWQPSEHPDFAYWVGPIKWLDTDATWSIERLLAQSASEQIGDLLFFEANHSHEASRWEQMSSVREACRRNVGWAFALGRALEERAAWTSGIWTALLGGLQGIDLTIDEWRELLTRLMRPELQAAHPYAVANALDALVRNGGKPFAVQLLELANTIAQSVWQVMPRDEQELGEVDDWLSYAVNRPAGTLVNFWLRGLSLLLDASAQTERVMPENYRQWFSSVVQDETANGELGRSLLASQAAFLFNLDEDWTRQHVIPLFSDADRRTLNQAWDGFFTWGHLGHALVEAMIPAFVKVFPRLSEVNDRHRRFIEFFAGIVVFHVSDPTEHLLPDFFRHASLEARVEFASRLGAILRRMEPEAKHQLWRRWLCRYWRDRLQGVHGKLNPAECREMLEWLPHLGDAFPEAVGLTVQIKPAPVGPTSVPRKLSTSDLIERFPTEAAELLVHLSGCCSGPHMGFLAAINERLNGIPEVMRRRVDEALAVAGIPRHQ